MLRLAAFLIFAPGAALACDFCSTSAVVDEGRATCFAKIFEDRMERLKRSGRGFVQVDLDSCLDEDGTGGSRSTVGTALNDPTDAYAEGGNLILAEEQMVCLRQLITDKSGALDPGLLLVVPFEC